MLHNISIFGCHCLMSFSRFQPNKYVKLIKKRQMWICDAQPSSIKLSTLAAIHFSKDDDDDDLFFFLVFSLSVSRSCNSFFHKFYQFANVSVDETRDITKYYVCILVCCKRFQKQQWHKHKIYDDIQRSSATTTTTTHKQKKGKQYFNIRSFPHFSNRRSQ